MDDITIGIDVSKDKLDYCVLPFEKYYQFSNDKDGIKILIRLILKTYSSVSRIVIEHTGAYQRSVFKEMSLAHLPVSLVNPAQPRAYAKALGRLGTTDKMDAFILAKFALQFDLRLSKYDENIAILRDLADQKRQLTALITADKNRLEKRPLKNGTTLIKQRLALFEKQLKEVIERIKEIITQTPEFAEKFKKIVSVQGVGLITALAILMECPEIGTLNKRQIAALAGVAPMNKDSGKQRGMAKVAGGRKNLRIVLYMAAVSAIRCNPIIKAFYQKLRMNGKPVKLAITACMRKLIDFRLFLSLFPLDNWGTVHIISIC